MLEIPGDKVIQARRRELLLESDINRQILELEWEQIHFRTANLKRGWLQSSWKWAAPIAGFLIARKFKKPAGVFAQGSFGLFFLRKIWEALR